VVWDLIDRAFIHLPARGVLKKEWKLKNGGQGPYSDPTFSKPSKVVRVEKPRERAGAGRGSYW